MRRIPNEKNEAVHHYKERMRPVSREAGVHDAVRKIIGHR